MIHAQLEADGSAIVTVDGHRQKLRGADVDEARAKLTKLAVETAVAQKKPVYFTSVEAAGTYNLIAHPDGRIEDADAPIKQEVAEPGGAVDPAWSANGVGQGLRDGSLLTTDYLQEPAAQGFRGFLTRTGLKTKPSAAELAERADIAAVSQHWPGTRTIAVINRKGGSNKTPTVAALSAVFARYGGGGVLAWDNSENQGTLGWRTEQGPLNTSVLDLLRDREHLLAESAVQTDVDGYFHHQSEDKYDVLRSDTNDGGDHEVTAAEVHAVHAVVEKFRRLIIMDSGDTDRAANWRAMIDHTSQVVVPTTTMEDRAEAARLTLMALAARDERSARLAENAVVVISEWKPGDQKEARRIRELFEGVVREVLTIPFDPALKAGHIRFNAMNPRTQRAWLAAGAAVARGL